jgi:hypothetical protein
MRFLLPHTGRVILGDKSVIFRPELVLYQTRTKKAGDFIFDKVTKIQLLQNEHFNITA